MKKDEGWRGRAMTGFVEMQRHIEQYRAARRLTIREQRALPM